MINEVIQKWEENKFILEEYFRKHEQSEYSTYEMIMRSIIHTCFYNAVFEEFDRGIDHESIRRIDESDYQGTILLVFRLNTYCPSEHDYLWTCVDYGSCSGCDTLENIKSMGNYQDERPTPEQVKQYMTLALHMVQKIKWLLPRSEK